MNSKNKYVYLGIFIFGIIMITLLTKIMLVDGFSEPIGTIVSDNRRFIYGLISIFGMIGFFIEIVFDKISEIIEKYKIK